MSDEQGPVLDAAPVLPPFTEVGGSESGHLSLVLLQVQDLGNRPIWYEKR
jgi:hypothetical protein